MQIQVRNDQKALFADALQGRHLISRTAQDFATRLSPKGSQGILDEINDLTDTTTRNGPSNSDNDDANHTTTTTNITANTVDATHNSANDTLTITMSDHADPDTEIRHFCIFTCRRQNIQEIIAPANRMHFSEKSRSAPRVSLALTSRWKGVCAAACSLSGCASHPGRGSCSFTVTGPKRVIAVGRHQGGRPLYHRHSAEPHSLAIKRRTSTSRMSSRSRRRSSCTRDHHECLRYRHKVAALRRAHTPALKGEHAGSVPECVAVCAVEPVLRGRPPPMARTGPRPQWLLSWLCIRVFVAAIFSPMSTADASGHQTLILAWFRRDYARVDDLTEGHVYANRKSSEVKAGTSICNLGSGNGYSVMLMIRAREEAIYGKRGCTRRQHAEITDEMTRHTVWCAADGQPATSEVRAQFSAYVPLPSCHWAEGRCKEIAMATSRASEPACNTRSPDNAMHSDAMQDNEHSKARNSISFNVANPAPAQASLPPGVHRYMYVYMYMRCLIHEHIHIYTHSCVYLSNYLVIDWCTSLDSKTASHNHVRLDCSLRCLQYGSSKCMYACMYVMHVVYVRNVCMHIM